MITGRIQIIIGVGAVVLIALVLFPVFRVGEPWLIYLLVAFVLVSCLVAVLAARTDRVWPRYALLGTAPGFLIGGVGVWALVKLGSGGTNDGWEDLIAIAAGIMSAFIGSIIGAVVGAIVGLLKERKEPAMPNTKESSTEFSKSFQQR